MATAEYLSAAETAKLVRVELAARFPGIRFSVRSQTYSGGSSIRVSWTDGPSTRQVDRAIGKFGGKTFDGMDDSTHYHDTEHNGRLVHFSNWAPSCSREVSNHEDWKAAAREMILARCHVEGQPGQERFGGDWVDGLADGMVWACDFREKTLGTNPLERAFRIVVMQDREI